MNKKYILFIFVIIIVYLLGLIINYKYKEYSIINYKNHISLLIEEKQKNINYNIDNIKYLESKAYKNKLLKEEQGYKNKGEKVIFITLEDNYKIYTQTSENMTNRNNKNINLNPTNNMNIKEKWKYFLLKIK